LPLLAENLSLEKLNEHLHGWIDGDYHQRIHSTTGQTPLQRYLAHLSLLRSAPKDLSDYFRVAVRRRVDKDRIVVLNGNLFEAPPGLIGKFVTLLYHPHDPQRVEVLFEEQSQGFLIPLNSGVNSRVRRVARHTTELNPPQGPSVTPPYRGGSLFQKGSTP